MTEPVIYFYWDPGRAYTVIGNVVFRISPFYIVQAYEEKSEMYNNFSFAVKSRSFALRQMQHNIE